MKMSASIELIWQLAGREAIAGDFNEVAPEHFLAAILKFVELPIEEVDRIMPGADASKLLAAEVTSLREELSARSIDSKKVRYDLRNKLGKGGCQYDGGQIHRSSASRTLFDEAARLADDSRSETVMAIHLLKAMLAAPTATIVEVLGELARPAEPSSSKMPLLDEFGKNLIKAASEGKLSDTADREDESKALLASLAQKDKKSVLLVCDDSKAVETVVHATARKMSSRNVPQALRNCRLIDISGINPYGNDSKENLEKLTKLFAEVSSAGNVILFVPALEIDQEDGQSGKWHDQLKLVLGRKTFGCICRVDPQVFEKQIRKNAEWNKCASMMCISKEIRHEIPGEL